MKVYDEILLVSMYVCVLLGIIASFGIGVNQTFGQITTMELSPNSGKLLINSLLTKKVLIKKQVLISILLNGFTILFV